VLSLQEALMHILSGISPSDATNCELPQLFPCSLQQYAEVAIFCYSALKMSVHPPKMRIHCSRTLHFISARCISHRWLSTQDLALGNCSSQLRPALDFGHAIQNHNYSWRCCDRILAPSGDATWALLRRID
jgi:hypothetical protein